MRSTEAVGGVVGQNYLRNQIQIVTNGSQRHFLNHRGRLKALSRVLPDMAYLDLLPASSDDYRRVPGCRIGYGLGFN